MKNHLIIKKRTYNKQAIHRCCLCWGCFEEQVLTKVQNKNNYSKHDSNFLWYCKECCNFIKNLDINHVV